MLNDINSILEEALGTKENPTDAYISSRKCPFRIDPNGYMMYCEPSCMACASSNEENFICLRLVNVKYETSNLTFLKTPKEEN